MNLAVVHDFPGLENGLTKFHDFPGRVVTLLKFHQGLWQQNGDADAAVEARIRIGCNKFRQLVTLLTNRDISLIRRGRLYSSSVRSSMLHGSETWPPVRKENDVALQRAEMRMVRWMCNLKVKNRVPSKELRERLGIDDIMLIHQNRLRWYGHVL